MERDPGTWHTYTKYIFYEALSSLWRKSSFFIYFSQYIFMYYIYIFGGGIFGSSEIPNFRGKTEKKKRKTRFLGATKHVWQVSGSIWTNRLGHLELRVENMCNVHSCLVTIYINSFMMRSTMGAKYDLILALRCQIFAWICYRHASRITCNRGLVRNKTKKKKKKKKCHDSCSYVLVQQ